MRDRTKTDRFSDYVLSVLKAIFLEILRVMLFLKGYFQKLSDKSEEQY